MISTITPNPGLTYGLVTLVRGEVQRPSSVSVEAGGRGTNVSRVAAPVGGRSGERFLPLLGESGVEFVCVPVEALVEAIAWGAAATRLPGFRGLRTSTGGRYASTRA